MKVLGSGPQCPYCKEESALVTGKELYPHRWDLYKKKFWACLPCKAWVGCHPDSTQPLGRLADAALRAAKSRVHAAFDPLWKGGSLRRSIAYAELAGLLNISKEECHIGMFDLERCQEALKVIETIEVSRRGG